MRQSIDQKLIAWPAIDAYKNRFYELYNTILTKHPENINYGLFRYSAIISFNETVLKMRNRSTSPQNDIMYRSEDFRDEAIVKYRYPRKIITFLSRYDVYNKFGLNYNDIMNLSFHEWTLLQQAIIPKQEEE